MSSDESQSLKEPQSRSVGYQSITSEVYIISLLVPSSFVDNTLPEEKLHWEIYYKYNIVTGDVVS